MKETWLRHALSTQDILALTHCVETDGKPGVRMAIDPPDTDLANALKPIITAVQKHVADAFPVRLVAFTKLADKGWSVPWHQDRVLALRARQEVDGFSAWQLKSKIWHADAPTSILSNMFFARVLLDDISDQDGGLTYAEHSHEFGYVPADKAEERALDCRPRHEIGKAGDILLLPALTLHCSKSSNSVRRVLRVDFAQDKLPERLEYASVYAPQSGHPTNGEGR